MRILYSSLIMFSTIFFLWGCAATPGSPEAVAEEEKEKKKAVVKATKKAVGEVPGWYITPPVESQAIYSTGVAKSSDLQMGMDRAMLAAKRDLASQINNRLSSKIKEFVSEIGESNNLALNREVTSVTKNVVTEVNLAGYRRTKSKLIPEGSTFRVFVLLRYPIGEANKMVMDQVKKSNKLRAQVKSSKAFQDLEKEIENARNRND